MPLTCYSDESDVLVMARGDGFWIQHRERLDLDRAVSTAGDAITYLEELQKKGVLVPKQALALLRYELSRR